MLSLRLFELTACVFALLRGLIIYVVLLVLCFRLFTCVVGVSVSFWTCVLLYLFLLDCFEFE